MLNFIELSAADKRKLPIGLQQLWRLHRGLCPIHGRAMSLAWEKLDGWRNGEVVDLTNTPIPLECSFVGCTAIISALDWNYPENENKPLCVERIYSEG